MAFTVRGVLLVSDLAFKMDRTWLGKWDLLGLTVSKLLGVWDKLGCAFQLAVQAFPEVYSMLGIVDDCMWQCLIIDDKVKQGLNLYELHKMICIRLAEVRCQRWLQFLLPAVCCSTQVPQSCFHATQEARSWAEGVLTTDFDLVVPSHLVAPTGPPGSARKEFEDAFDFVLRDRS